MPRVIEVNMLGEIIWEYALPLDLRQYTNPGFDVELLPNDNVLFVLPGKGVYEVDRSGNTVWSYVDAKVSHDADRLPNGNTIMVFGNEDTVNDAQVKEVNPAGKIVWSWKAGDYYDKPPYDEIYNQGWSHTNAVTRLPDGNTLISLRNFNMLVEVDPQGEVVATYGENFLVDQHDPAVLPDGNILVANHDTPHTIIEFNPDTGSIIWQFVIPDRNNWPVRDANRLPNGNTLITGTTKILEVTRDSKIVWEFALDATFQGPESAARGFYKAERIDP
jgi:outer membrane protein assembly factor BamB